MLRIIAINDVYELDNLPRLRTLVEQEKAAHRNVVTTLAGDFLAPSLLSSLDKGKSMVSCLNRVPVDIVCFGNHESDVPYSSLVKRVEEYEGKWLNSNMEGFEPALPTCYIMELVGDDNKSKRKVAFLGFLIGGGKFGNTYREDAFNGHSRNIEPVLEAAPKVVAKIRAQHPDLDALIPVTHQDMPEDVELAKTGMFPVVIGGHDHDQFHEVHHGCPVIKAGQDATHAAIIDLVWSGEAGEPLVTVSLKDLSEVHPDAKLAKYVATCLEPVEELAGATLCNLSEGTELTSKNSRFQPVSMGTKVATALRDQLSCDGALVNSGAVRAEAVYTKSISFADLQKECPFPSVVVVIGCPGSTLSAAVKHSRSKWINEPGIEAAEAFQCDAGMTFNAAHDMQTIQSKPIELERIYWIAVDTYDLKKNPILSEYAAQHSDKVPPEDSGRPVLPILVDYFCMQLWRMAIDEDLDGSVDEWELESFFNKHDLNGDGSLDEAEIRAILEPKIGNGAGIIAKSMLCLLDTDRDGKISRLESKKGLNQYGAMK